MDSFSGMLAAVIITVIATAIHYEALSIMWRTTVSGRARRKVLFVMLGLLTAHVIEIWMFGIAYLLLTMLGLGNVSIAALNNGAVITDLVDFVYYSASVYTTLGFGDLVPEGPMRFVTGAEALVGLCLITWSASFTFLEMQRHWPARG